MSKKKIMVADDDPSIVEALQYMLEDNGYEVETTTDGQTVQDMKEEIPDVLLLDIWMSGMDGAEICRSLKKQTRTKSIPVIMISANRDTEQIAKESGADDFIVKPFEMKELLTKVKKYAHQ